jgi:hypothetical protein
VIGGEALGDQTAMTGLRITLDAEQRRSAVGREARRDPAEVGAVEGLGNVATTVFRGEPGAGALAHAEPVVGAVLQVSQLGRRGELDVVPVADPGLGQSRLQPGGVRPRILAAADTAALPHIEHDSDVRVVERREERFECPAVGADRRERKHDVIIACGFAHARLLPPPAATWVGHPIQEGFMTNVKQTADSGGSGSAQSTTEQAKERVVETAQQVQDQVGQKAGEVRGQAGERVRQELDTRSTQAGEQVSTTADAIRKVGEQLRSEGKHSPARYADQVAERAERLGRYLSQADADKLLRDLEGFARRQPWIAAAGGAVLGFLASRFVKASSANRYQEAYTGNGAGRELTTGLGSEPATASFTDVEAELSPPQTGQRSVGRGEL